MCIRTIDQPDRQGTPDVNGKLNNVDSLIKTIIYNKLLSMEDFNLRRFLQHQLRVTTPTLCTRPSLYLLDPTKRSLRNPTLKDCKAQLA